MSGWTDKRPMSPHLQVWKWHVTMLGSILHRATGIGNYVGAFVLVAWLFAATMGEESYNQFASIAGSVPGQVILFGFTLSVVYHLLNGLRHLVWDTGHGFQPKFASFTGIVVLLLAIIGAVAIWVVTGLVPGVDPFGLAGGVQ